MARMRTLKPTFFQNERLADLSMGARLLFQGLWCLADREGRLEDRPRRIKAEVLPYDDCDVDQFLDDLAAAGFIERYEAAGMRLIQVLKFRKHQTPHIKETASTLPAPDEPSANPVQAPDDHHSSTPSSGEWGVGSGLRAPDHGLQEPEDAKELESPDAVVAAAPPTAAEPSVDLLDRVNQTLTGQPGWEPTPTQLRKLGEIAERHELDLELEALKIADYMRKPKRKDTQCTFRYVADWLGREQRNGSNGHGENRQHPGRPGSGTGRADAGPGAGGAGEDDPFAKYVIRDPVPSGDPGGP